MADKYYFLNVGCANCTVLYLADKVVMIDCHQGNLDDKSQANILDYIGNKIDVLIITHQHYDHFDGMQTLIDNNIEVVEIWSSPYERRTLDNSVSYEEWADYNELVSDLKKNGTKLYSVSQGHTELIGGATFQILHPLKTVNDIETRELHDASLVINIINGTHKLLFTGDASDWALEQVRNNYNLSKKYILHASHHGSINGAELDFIKLVNPNYTIISTKSGKYSNVPHPTALKRYRDNTITAVRRTDVDGTRVFK